MVIWRHGRTTWNAQRRFQGHSDVPLDEVGREQARVAAQALALLEPTHIVSSDLERARHTAGALAELTGLEVGVDERLRETFAGEWQGLTREELEAKYLPELTAWGIGADLRPGGGERRSEVAARMVAAVTEAMERVPSGGTLVVATHGGAARAAIGALIELPQQHWSALGVLTNCAWSVLKETEPVQLDSDSPPELHAMVMPQWRLQEYNAKSLPEESGADDR